MIERCENLNIFEAPAEALVNPVNIKGVSGRGLALEFKNKFPVNYRLYREYCKQGKLKPGKLLIIKVSEDSVKYIINFPTKRHYKDPSRLEDVAQGLWALRDWLNDPKCEIKSLALPPLGCGLGGLKWPDVEILIYQHLSGVSQKVLLCLPE
jgi:O-acetyl-ADP-ribose deacetylase (regulator of RNase III)